VPAAAMARATEIPLRTVISPSSPEIIDGHLRWPRQN
jgi:hypothetical protein